MKERREKTGKEGRRKGVKKGKEGRRKGGKKRRKRGK